MNHPDDKVNEKQEQCKCVCEFAGMMNVTSPCDVCPQNLVEGCSCHGYPEGCPLANK